MIKIQKIQILLIGLILTNYSFAQISYKYNKIRTGDEIIKQQVQYKDPGRSGDNIIWDFGNQELINDEYSLTYSSPYLFEDTYYVLGSDTISRKNIDGKELIIATEHSTMYYLLQDSTKLEILGHENSTTLLKYSKPVQIYKYPLFSGEIYNGEYTSQGKYSSIIDFESNGKYQSYIDGKGMMVIPSGDTLQNVIRIKYIEEAEEIIKGTGNEDDLYVNTIWEKYKWFSKGYRYPIFETITTINAKDSLTDKEYFSTAFFFPPQNHYYLDNDKENDQLLDSLWDSQNSKKPELTLSDIPNQNINFTYNFYPNPVSTILTLEYYLDRKSDVNISIMNISGKFLKTINKPSLVAGLYNELIDFQNLPSGNYILSISTGYNVYSDKIIKK